MKKKEKSIEDFAYSRAYASFHKANIGYNFLRQSDLEIFTKQQVFGLYYPALYRLGQISGNLLPGWKRINKQGWENGELKYNTLQSWPKEDQN